MFRYCIVLGILIVMWSAVAVMAYRYLDRIETQIILQKRV